ncbi:MAG: LamG domain-containing protein, partial [Planctomycetes bacterium]|nr:LamG domain-containing protein [Planctomycetota bacterium]
YSKIEVAIPDLASGIGSDWTAAGAKALSLWFCGSTGNSIESMWVELTDGAGGKATVTYGDYADEDPCDIDKTSWHEWNIDLQDFDDGGVNVANVSSMAIGFGNPIATTPGGSGLIYFDDIRLYAPRCILSRRDADFALVDFAPEGDPNGDCVIDYKELDVMSRDWLEYDYNIEAVEPNAAGLVAWYELENDANDSSPNGHDGTENGMPLYAAGQVGQAISLDGFDDYIDCGTNSAFNLTDGITVACWIKVTTFDKTWQAIVTKGDNSWRIHRWSTGNGINWAHTGLSPLSMGGSTNVNDGAWHHIAGTYDGTNRVLYVDGQVDASDTPTGTVSTSTHPVRIGENAQATGRFWSGMIDEVRIYNYALTLNEIVSVRGLGTVYVPVTSPANIYDAEPVTEKKVNFLDYAILTQRWLDEDMFP